jgi:AcrR family transcriptional regulator
MARTGRLKAADFVDAALHLAAEHGYASLTLKQIGQHLGVDTTAVYRHFANKDELLAAMLDRSMDEALLPAVPGKELEWLERVAWKVREIFMRHPPLVMALVARETGNPNSFTLDNRVIAAFAALGLHGDDLVAHFQAFDNFVLGASLVDGISAPRHWELRALYFRGMENPAMVGAGASDERVRDLSERAFAQGLRAILSAAADAATTTPPARTSRSAPSRTRPEA